MTPKQILERLIERATGISDVWRRKRKSPGEMIENLKPEEREILKNLTSKDAEDMVRPEFMGNFCEEYYRSKDEQWQKDFRTVDEAAKKIREERGK